jgi:hypothetical protein
MTQRKIIPQEKVITDSTPVEPEYILKWPTLYKTQTIKRDLDKHLVMLNIMPTTDKNELNKMVKK